MFRRIPKTVRSATIALTALVALLGVGAAPVLTPAPTSNVAETIWGVKIADPYRYLEDEHDARTVSFFRTQAAFAQNYLAQLGPAKAKLAARIRELDRSSVTVGSLARVDGRYFFERQNPSDESPALYFSNVGSQHQELLVNPAARNTGKTHHTMDWFVPSLNGRYVAYGISAGGSEDSALEIYDTKMRARLPEHIDRARFGVSGFLPNSTALFYIRLPKTNAQTPIIDRERYLRCYLHVLGSSARYDRAVFGWHVDPAIPFAPDDEPSLTTAPNSPYVIASISHGVQNETTIYSTTIAALLAGRPHWRKLIDTSDGVTSYDVQGSTLYLLSHRGAPTNRIIAMPLDRVQAPHEIVHAGKAVIEQIGVAQDALYVRLLTGGIGRIARVHFTDLVTAPRVDALKTIELPYPGTVTGLQTDPRVAGLTFGLTSWTHSLLYYVADASGHIHDTHIKPLSPIDASPYTSREVFARSADGTQIPLSIIMKKGTVLDGSHPTYLEGYGAYGVVLAPYFSTTRIAWLERGGVYAVAHLRGGGEYGEAWHAAAMRANKARSIADYIACAKYLIDEKYTAPALLGGEGTSAGGIVIGGAITQAPQLFAAALDVVGVSDALRSEFSSNGPSNIPEFGTIKNHAEFTTLRTIDAYQNVKDGVAYPAVMLITGLHDPRVPPWELGKFAARLQAASSSGKPIILRVDADAGHGFLAASRSQSEALATDEFAFLLAQMGRL